jgi:phytoene dehydrogenase-like protein
VEGVNAGESAKGMQMAQTATVAVVGGGMAGLAAAAFAARAGARVTLFERMSESGGRARSREDHGFTFNMGPHALYLCGEAMAALRELGVDPPGNSPATSGGLAWCAGKLHALPGGAVSLLTTGLLGAAEKLEFGRMFAMLPKLDTKALVGTPLSEYLAREVRSPRVRELLLAVVRVTSYSHAPDAICAGAALEQLALGLGKGVRYLDGGWQALVDAVEAKTHEFGVTLRRGAAVERVVHDGAARGLELADGERVTADAVILALGPDEASELVDGGSHPFFARALAARIPVRAACLDLGLAKLPNPKRVFALGIDRALYFSVHSAAAKLAPEGAALVQMARYLAPDEHPEREELEAELERMLDAVQPGWRAHVVTRRLMRDLVVTHDLPQAARGGITGRTPGQVTGIANLWLAGDWVGPSGMLVDGCFASARAAARGAAGAGGVRVAA